MKTITFTPTGFEIGNTYSSQLLLNNNVVDSKDNLVANTQYTYTVTIPGTYLLKVMNLTDNTCVFSEYVQALFPLITYSTSEVNCNNNEYSFIINISNPTTAGNNIQFGWSLLNDCATVSAWTNNTTLILPADDVTRYVFVKNTGCCNLIITSSESPCITCTLNVTNISFNCG